MDGAKVVLSSRKQSNVDKALAALKSDGLSEQVIKTRNALHQIATQIRTDSRVRSISLVRRL